MLTIKGAPVNHDTQIFAPLGFELDIRIIWLYQTQGLIINCAPVRDVTCMEEDISVGQKNIQKILITL